jgi:hypothetical protein
MTAMEDKPAGSVGDVGQHGDKWSFTLFDAQDREIVAFTFRDESTARARGRNHTADCRTRHGALAGQSARRADREGLKN